MPQTPEQRLAWHLASTFRLDRQDRLDLASMIVGRDIGSWAQLTDPEWTRLTDALHGYALVNYLRTIRHGPLSH